MKTLAGSYAISKICALVGTLILCGTYAAEAGGFIYAPTQPALEAALAGGGTATFECSGTIVLTNTISISQDTVLDGNGFTVTISGGNAVRIFQVASGVSYWIKSLTLSDGNVMAPNGADGSPPSPGQDALGGAVLCQGGNLTLTGCTLSNNFVQGGYGGTETNYSPSGVSADGGTGAGGAIFVSGGSLSLTNCALLSSVAVGGIGGLPHASPGAGGSACGGAIYMSNVTATFAQVMFASNRLMSGAAQCATMGVGAGGGFALGGAICVTNSTVLIANSSFFSSSVIAADVTNISLPGAGPGSGAGIGGSLFVSQGSTATIQTSSFSNNAAQGGSGFRYFAAGPAMGGAIASYGSLLLSDCSISGNHMVPGSDISGLPGRGGGVYAEGPLTLNRCTFENNQAIGGAIGGVVYIYPGYGGVGEGGAIWSSGTLMATNCTCATNLALGGGGAPNYGGPGSGGPGRGGAIFTSGGGALVNLTLAYNRADSQASGPSPPGPAQGGGVATTNVSLTVRGTIIADSSNDGEVWGFVTDAGYNICSDETAGFTAAGSLNNTDPLLGPLANNGGPTETIALQPGSPALDAIPFGFPPTDQRGVLRPQGPAADMGACEGGALLPPPPNAPLLSTYLTNSRPPVLGGYIAVSFIGQSNVVYRLLSSSNLTTWSSIATNSTGPIDGPVTFNRLLSNGPAFYRVVTP